ncbi:amidohydrolase [Haloquadratum walsbyi]|jgi:amidohydrolase|uniref:Amidohydrolase n=1 Tax=Haloquadratum walsbyi J07HQW2 TaxID=1238425 RepID=U1NDZ0_9EURY|nr:amidohydrolase [Haloquadratum walsbyi]ERG94958.1 MAG: amidohydrolase [Haloquadratum walsbyi J07HQW2]
MTRADLVTLRRDLHQHPEPAWREFYTTARLVDELETRDLDGIYIGPEVLDDNRRGVPDDEEIATWRARAEQAGAREDILEQLPGGQTGVCAVIECGPGPTVGLRVDIDGLPITESMDNEHHPASEGFRSKTEGHMHACGHDAHAAIGVGVLDAIIETTNAGAEETQQEAGNNETGFTGTLKVFFQPGEEQIVGGKPMAASGRLDDIDALFAVHVGLDHPSGEVVAGIDDFLAVSHFEAEFTGMPAHAGARPEDGDNAVQAMATAVQNLYAIPRHTDGATRVNAGVVSGGTATNIIPEHASINGEVRGETTKLMEYTESKATQVLESAATMHNCEVEMTTAGRAPSATSDDILANIVAEVASDNDNIDSVMRSDDLGGSEDATFLMRRVQQNGGVAAYIGVGTDHPGGHHTDTFDIDEASIGHGVEILTNAIITTETKLNTPE